MSRFTVVFLVLATIVMLKPGMMIFSKSFKVYFSVSPVGILIFVEILLLSAL